MSFYLHHNLNIEIEKVLDIVISCLNYGEIVGIVRELSLKYKDEPFVLEYESCGQDCYAKFLNGVKVEIFCLNDKLVEMLKK